MAVGTPYGWRAYGKGPYARATGRPYSVGPYGVGHYERFQSNTFDVAGACAIRFGATAGVQRMVGVYAATSINFVAWAAGPAINMHAEALSSITLSAWAEARLTWDLVAPCSAGAWQPVTCSTGTWQSPGTCSPGTWGLRT